MSKKFVLVLAVVFSFFLMTGCYTVKMASPPGDDVRLLTSAEKAAFKTEQRNWYVIYGLVPIINADDAVQKTIKDNNLTEVKLETKITVIDWLIGAFLGFVTVTTNTTVIEGNSK